MRFRFSASPRPLAVHASCVLGVGPHAILRFWQFSGKALQHALVLTVAVVLALFLHPAEGHDAPLPQLATRVGGIIGGSLSWVAWKARFLSVDGRVVDTGNNDVSHSEGQGYGLLLAVAADDRQAFELMRRWTHAHLGPRADGLFTWRWSPDPKAVPDRNNATDGDILIAWALAEAADHWNDPALRDEGTAIATTIGRTLVLKVPGVGPVLLPGLYGFDAQSASDGPIVNPSYWLFQAFHRLSQLAPDTNWDDVARTGLRLIEQARVDGRPPADWLSLAHGKPRPALRFPARFSYDALRIPLYLTLAGGSNHPELLRVFPVASKGISVVSVVDGGVVETAQGDGYAAIAGLVRCATERAAYPRALTASDTKDAYYPATLRLLAQVAALADPRSCLDPSEVSKLRSQEWSPRRPSLPVSAPHVFSIAASSAQKLAARPVTTAADPVAEPFLSLESAFVAGLPLCIGAGLGLTALRRRRRQATTLNVDDLAAASGPRAPALPSLTSKSASVLSAVPTEVPRPAALPPGLQPGNLSLSGREEGFAAHIELVASASAEWRQHVGLIVLAHCGRSRCVNADMDRAVAAIRATLRRADRVSVIGPTEIGICIGLLNDEDGFSIAASRIEGVLATAFVSPDVEGSTGGSPFTSVRALVSSKAVSGYEALSQLRTAGFEAVERKTAPAVTPHTISAETTTDALPAPAPKKASRKSKAKALVEVEELKASQKGAVIKQTKVIKIKAGSGLLSTEGTSRKRGRPKAPLNVSPLSSSLAPMEAGHADRRPH